MIYLIKNIKIIGHLLNFEVYQIINTYQFKYNFNNFDIIKSKLIFILKYIIKNALNLILNKLC